MAKKKKTVKRRKPAKKRSRVVRKREHRKKAAPRKSVTVQSLLSRAKKKLNARLEKLLFRRDQAKSYKQHRSAQLAIDNVRAKLRQVS